MRLAKHFFVFSVTFVASLLLSAIVSAQELSPEQVLTQSYIVTSIQGADALIEELNTWCERIAADGKHYGPGGMFCEDMNSLAWFQGHTVWSIASAMPYLKPEVAASLKAYLQKEVEDYLLKDELYAYEQDGKIDLPEVKLTWKGQTAPRWEAIYALWAYAHYCNDWPTIEKNWPFIQKTFRGCKLNPTLVLASTGQAENSINSEIAGLVGYYRMAIHMKDSGAPAIMDQARSRFPLLLQRADWPAACAPAAGRGNQQPHSVINLLFLSQFNNMTPEAARYLAANRPQQAKARIEEVEQDIPFWWMSSYNVVGGGGNVVDWGGGDESTSAMPAELKEFRKNAESKNWSSFPTKWAIHISDNRVGGSEGNFQNPMFATQVFQAKAMVLMDDVKELSKKRPWLNEFATMPWYRDIQGLRNLVVLIERHGQVVWH